MDELVDLLRHHGVELLVDVRTVPASRRMPHFARASLERSLPEQGIAYRHMPELGGLRKPSLVSINTGWRNDSFRGYADYMQTFEFWDAIASLEELAREGQIAGGCAEAVPWRCHRSLIADALVARGDEVAHILGVGDPRPHRMTPFARVENGRIAYPPADTLPL